MRRLDGLQPRRLVEIMVMLLRISTDHQGKADDECDKMSKLKAVVMAMAMMMMMMRWWPSKQTWPWQLVDEAKRRTARTTKRLEAKMPSRLWN